jgi:signal transduction histidine kinase
MSVDVESLKQVVVNIGLNAIQAMPDGGILSIESQEADAGLLITISDTGMGMDEDQVHKIFDPFYTTKDVGEGTGLGLFVTYALVQNMNGRIKVESRKGQGACFQLELPIQNAENVN